MKRIIVLLFVLFCVAGCSSSGGQSERSNVLRVGMECDYAPFNWTQVDDSEYSDVSEPPIPDGGAIPIPEMRTTHSENITTLKTGRSIIS